MIIVLGRVDCLESRSQWEEKTKWETERDHIGKYYIYLVLCAQDGLTLVLPSWSFWNVLLL